MCTRYNNWPDYWNTDQRSLWQSFRDDFNSSFGHTWISANYDLSEYDDLIGKASALGLEGIWLYQKDDNTDSYSDNNVSTFASYAWKWGWLIKVERLYYYSYTCTKPNPCDCDRNNITDGWELQTRTSTSTTRNVSF